MKPSGGGESPPGCTHSSSPSIGTGGGGGDHVQLAPGRAPCNAFIRVFVVHRCPGWKKEPATRNKGGEKGIDAVGDKIVRMSVAPGPGRVLSGRREIDNGVVGWSLCTHL